ncbi:MAG: GNAT family N-acetyltransferase [Anaerolineales bacterium]|nr:GNAT family N-acetyltransferase [Anaerolineales bacterium]
MTVTIRPAVETDQATIVSLIHQARISPRNLHWERFLVAEEDNKIVGLRQVKVYKGGTREVGSGYVIPEYQHRGISAQLMNAIFARESGPLYVMCNKKWKAYYEGFGFQDVKLRELPSDFYREYLVAKVITSVIAVIAFQDLNIIPMKRMG